MGALFFLILLVALALIAPRWGVDSRRLSDDHGTRAGVDVFPGGGERFPDQGERSGGGGDRFPDEDDRTVGGGTGPPLGWTRPPVGS